MNDEELSPAAMERCAALLQRLVEQPGLFLEKRNAAQAQLRGVRSAANRLIVAIQRAVRIRRGQPPGGREIPRAGPAFDTGPTVDQPPADHADARLAKCYVCHARFSRAHALYPRLCPACGDFNAAKREQSGDLTGRRAVVTGGRIRIGYQTALKLLRAGAAVEMATRFPFIAAERYAREPDYAVWRERVRIQGVDFRHLAAVQAWAGQLADQGPVDILINNAAQTVRRPAAYYDRLVARETQFMQSLPSVVRACVAWEGYPPLPLITTGEQYLPGAGVSSTLTTAPAGSLAALLTQVRLTEEDWRLTAAQFLTTAEDAEGDPVDPREDNSWRQEIGEIPPVELLEVHVINALAPFLLIQDLLPSFRRSPFARRFIVNVAAKEGQFAGDASARHPHTNMAKSALNMLTRTIAPGLAAEGIYVNGVDPGWVSDQRPFPVAEGERRRLGDWLPLDPVDAAARVLDTVFTGLVAEPPPSGQLWKNYHPEPW